MLSSGCTCNFFSWDCFATVKHQLLTVSLTRIATKSREKNKLKENSESYAVLVYEHLFSFEKLVCLVK